MHDPEKPLRHHYPLFEQRKGRVDDLPVVHVRFGAENELLTMNRKRDASGRFVKQPPSLGDSNRRLVPMPTRRASRPEPVFNEVEEPVISHEHRAQSRRWNRVPYPYQFKWDGGWIFIAFLAAGGFAFKPLWLLAGFIALLRCVVWCSFRWPLTTMFFVSFFSGLMGGRRRR